MQDAPALSAQAALELSGESHREARWRVIARTAYPFVVVGAVWELVARMGMFPARLFPPLEQIAETFVRLTAQGILPHHALDTILRLAPGFGLAMLAGRALAPPPAPPPPPP